MQNFDRQYRMSAGRPRAVGFEIGDTTPYAPHIAFSIQKQELESSNTAKGRGNSPGPFTGYSEKTLLSSTKQPSSTLTFATSSCP